MKKIITLLLCMTLGLQTTFAQFEVIGSADYGRLFDVIYDPVIPNKLYAITLGNHIVSSNDNGQNWEILYSFPVQSSALEGLRYLDGNQLSFYSRFIASTSLLILDLNALQIVTEFVLPVPPGSDTNWIEAYDIFESNKNMAIIQQGYRIGIANFAKVYYTSDGGVTFQEIYHNTDYDSVFPNNVAIHPSDPDIVFIARGNGPANVDGGLFKSMDAGVTWVEKLPGDTFDAIAFHPQNPNIMLLGTSIGDTPQNLYRSTDTGENWSDIPINWTDLTLDNITVIKYNPTNPNNIIVLEENEIVITNDDFSTWQNYVYPNDDVHSYYYGLHASFNPFQTGELYISGNYHVLFSADGGQTVSWAKNPYFHSTGNMDFFKNNQESHLYYGVQFGYVHRDMQSMTETPYEVQPLDYVSSSPGIAVSTDPSIPGRVYTFEGGFTGSTLYVSSDHGMNRDPIYSTFSGSLHAVSSKPANPTIIWASFSSFGDNPELLEIDFSDMNNILVTPVNLPMSNVVTDIFFNQNLDEIILAIGTSILKSTDGGTTWLDTSNGLNTLFPFQDYILKLSVNPFDEDQISIATTQGIFITTNGGVLWEQKTFDTINTIAYSTETNGHLVAVTHNSDVSLFGITYSINGGVTWETVSSVDLHYISSAATAIDFFENSADVYIGTSDLGLVKYTIDLNALNIPDYTTDNGFLKLYPNPVNEILNVDTGNETMDHISIYTITGQKVLDSPGKNSFNISELQAGVYFIKVTFENGTSNTGKIIKK